MNFEIHEFSTGINVQPLANGGWVSTGFTGRYMNQTLDQIPIEVERAIANREFAVSEGSYSDSPAIIAKNISLDNPASWGDTFYSVVAVVSKGTDEKGRSASFYRYFLCESTNEDGIVAVLKWMVKYKNLHQDKNWPEFDPLHPIRLGKSHSLSPAEMGQTPAKNMISGKLTILSEVPSSETYIWPSREKTCSPLILHYVAKELSDSNPVAWAYGVEAIEKPWGFKVIFPASEYAEQMITRLLQTPPKIFTSSRVDEEGLKATIKALTGVTNIRPEPLQAFFEALENDEITDEYWFDIIDNKRGARQSISSGVVSPELIRLMTIRSLISEDGLLGRSGSQPNTIDAGYLSWIFSQETSKQKKIIEDSLIFQGQLKGFLQTSGIDHSKFFGRLEEIIRQTIVAIPTRNDIDVKQISWLFCEKQSIWSVMSTTLLKVIVKDLTLIYQYKTNDRNVNRDEFEKTLWLDFHGYWSKLYQAVDARSIITSKGQKYILQCNRPNNFYWPLVQFLESMPASSLRANNITHNYHRLASYFSQIAKGNVRKKLFLSAFYPQRRTTTTYLELEIARQISPDEYIEQAVRGSINWFWSKEEEMNKGQTRRLIVGGVISGLLLGMLLEGRFAMGSNIPIIGKIFSQIAIQEPIVQPTQEPTLETLTTGGKVLYFVFSNGMPVDNISGDNRIDDVQEILHTAKDSVNFEMTQSSIKRMINDVSNSMGVPESQVNSAFKNILVEDVDIVKKYRDREGDEFIKFNLAGSLKQDTDENSKEFLIALIYAFQKQYIYNNENHKYGYIRGGEKTLDAIIPILEEKIGKTNIPPQG